ncbi:hypothetical protein MK805_09700 [Shimazuella sp. AN120528]|uniref:hypothetical protein n=1 Tax=Shimazuella soli TaxID=1892854 RepID=UPI001F0E63B5|nr:hypothetical protein [Shimazuella soli]MCH5585242.1 hypothetical protein [Shimazuella soli]
MNHITGVMNMHFKAKWWFFIPWIITFLIFGSNLVISFLIGVPISYPGSIAPTCISLLVIAIVIVIRMFPFALGLSVRRTDFFLGATSIFAVISAGFAIVLFLFSLVEQWTGGWGTKLHFFHLSYLNDGSVIEQLLTSFVFMLNMCFLGVVIGSIFQRFGRTGLLIFFGTVFVVATIGSLIYGWWVDIFHLFIQHSAFELAIGSIPLVVIYILASYVMLRKATV